MALVVSFSAGNNGKKRSRGKPTPGAQTFSLAQGSPPRLQKPYQRPPLGSDPIRIGSAAGRKP